MCRICDAIKLNNHAVAIYREKSIPEDAHVPKNGHCTIPSLLMRCVRLGDKCAADSEHSPCHGSKSGFGFGGIASRQRTSWSVSTVPEDVQNSMKHQGSGQSYFRDPDIGLIQLELIKDYGDGTDAIIFQDLDEAIAEKRPIEVVTFIVDPTRLSALQQLAAFSKTTPGPAAIMPFGYGCQQVYALPRAEGESDDPHAIVGMTDIYPRRFVSKDQLSFAVPYKLYQRMLNDLDRSFLMKEKYQANFDMCL